MQLIARLNVREPQGWDRKKLVVMEALLRDKFWRDSEMRERLVQIGQQKLINVIPNDYRKGGGEGGMVAEERLFWGKSETSYSQAGERKTSQGENHLGELLE